MPYMKKQTQVIKKLMRREGSKYPTSQSKNSSDRLSQCLFDPVGVELPRQIWSSKNSKASLGKIATLYVCHLVVVNYRSTVNFLCDFI